MSDDKDKRTENDNTDKLQDDAADTLEDILIAAAQDFEEVADSAKQPFEQEAKFCNSGIRTTTDTTLSSGFTESPNLPERYEQNRLDNTVDGLLLAADINSYLKMGEHSPAPQLSSIVGDDKLVYAEYALGQGRVVFGSDWRIWDNRNIVCRNHAFYLAYLAQGARKVWFIQNLDAPSLWALVWSKAYLFAIAFSLMLIFLVWHLMFRFGPIRLSTFEKERNFIEHFNAVGYLAWRMGRAESLIFPIYKDVFSLLKESNCDFQYLNSDEKIHYLNTLDLVPHHDIVDLINYVEAAFEQDHYGNLTIKSKKFIPALGAQTFIHMVSTLKTIKASL